MALRKLSGLASAVETSSIFDLFHAAGASSPAGPAALSALPSVHGSL
jgi:hypothetical protein